MPFGFEVLSEDGKCKARVGRLATTHGETQTPVFMPVGTQATVKTLAPAWLEEVGATIVLCNAFHLHLRPGEDVIRSLGGLHKFMGWNGPILTDSGGYQLFSLAELADIDDEGVAFRSHIDGRKLFLTPEDVVRIQEALGADIIMALDECVSYPCSKNYAWEAAARTLKWARRARDALSLERVALFGIVQGSTYADLREHCARKLTEMNFPGYAIGGLSVGEGPSVMHEMLDVTLPLLPEDKPRYLMGVGPPEQILECIEKGIDMFDCVLPTRNGRSGYAFTSRGIARLRNQVYQNDSRPLDESCNCYCCRNFSRGYLRHLFQAGEMLGLTLVSLHNLAFFCKLIHLAREAIKQGNFTEFKQAFTDRYGNRD